MDGTDCGFQARSRAGRLPGATLADSLLNRVDANGLSFRQLIAGMGDH